MSARDVEAEIDRLYRLPPDQFTKARNDLAKRLEGEKSRRVKALRKPNLPAWAVNQLYWTSPDIHEHLRKTIDRLRQAHRLVISRRPADLRGASADHREALKKALTRVHEILRESGHPINTETTRAVTQTLEALRKEDSPGRLDRPLASEGFDALKDVVLPRGRGLRASPAIPSKVSYPSGKRNAAAEASPRTGALLDRGQRASAVEVRRAERAALRDRALARHEAKQNLKKVNELSLRVANWSARHVRHQKRSRGSSKAPARKRSARAENWKERSRRGNPWKKERCVVRQPRIRPPPRRPCWNAPPAKLATHRSRFGKCQDRWWSASAIALTLPS